MDDPPLFSVIIFCEHDSTGLACTLAALAQQAEVRRPVEVLVLDPADDGGRAAVAAAAGARRISPCAADRVEAWNEGWRCTSGRWVAFTDDDCQPEPEWLCRLGEALAGGAVLAGGPDRAPDGLPRFLRHLDYVLTSPAGTAGLRTGGAASAWYPRHWNLAADREALLDAGGFAAALPEAWELDLTRRMRAAGGRAAFVPNAVVKHRRETTWPRFLARNVRLARSRAEGGGQRLLFALPLLGLAGVVALALASIWIPSVRVPLALVVAAYIAGIGGAGVHAAVKLRDPAALAGVPLLLLGQHVSHAAGFLAGLVRRVRPKSPPERKTKAGPRIPPLGGAS
jgi:hypothetical protein